jgi:hypothetical protein
VEHALYRSRSTRDHDRALPLPSAGGTRRPHTPRITVGDDDVLDMVVWEVVDPAPMHTTTIHGRVTTPSGRAVADAYFGGNDRVQWIWTDAHGRYRASVNPGTVRLPTSCRGEQGSTSTFIDVPIREGETLEQDLVLSHGLGVVDVRVLDRDRRPIGNAMITATACGNSSDADAEGRARFRAQEGVRRVMASRDWSRAPTSIDVGVRADQVTPVEIVIEKPTSRITGVVVDARGAPVPNAAIVNDSASSLKTVALTAADGSFVLEDLEIGNHTLRVVSAAGEVTSSCTTDVPARLELVPHGSVEGFATIDGELPDLLPVQLKGRGHGDRRETFVYTHGHFAFERLRPGSYEVIIQTELLRGTAEVEVRAGERTELVIELQDEPL